MKRIFGELGVFRLRGPLRAPVRESAMKPVGKPDAGNRHVRFDERGWETGRRSCVSTRAHPRLYRPSTAEGQGDHRRKDHRLCAVTARSRAISRSNKDCSG